MTRENAILHMILRREELKQSVSDLLDEDIAAFDMAIEALEQQPSAQPEIVRCSQCKYAEVADSEDSQDGYTCQFHRGSIWFSGSYCSWAERKVKKYDA